MTTHMKQRNTTVSEFDYPRLQEILERQPSAQAISGSGLRRELQRACVVAPEHIPPYVVTMNTQLRLTDTNTGKATVYTLVFPEEAAPEDGRLSILSELGVALLGCCVGDTVEYESLNGRNRCHIDMICFQPEATKQFEM